MLTLMLIIAGIRAASGEREKYMNATADNGNPGFLTRLKTWAMHPVTTQMDFLDVVLTVLLVATAGFAWIIVLKHLTGDAE